MLERTARSPQQRVGRWQRAAAAVLLLLVGGAVVTVAVAWACVCFAEPQQAEWRDWDSERDPLGAVHARIWPSHHPTHPWAVGMARGVGLETVTLSSGWGFISEAEEVTAGWPLRCISRHRSWDLGATRDRSAHEISVSLPGIGQQRLPLRPILPGFVVNTLLYAMLLWLLGMAVLRGRRIIRRRRCLCETCAYPVGVNAVCTECGAAVRAPRHRAADGGHTQPG